MKVYQSQPKAQRIVITALVRVDPKKGTPYSSPISKEEISTGDPGMDSDAVI